MHQLSSRIRPYQSQPTHHNPPSLSHYPSLPHDVSDIQTGNQNNISKFNCRDGPTEIQKPTDCYCMVIYVVIVMMEIAIIIMLQESSVRGYENPFDSQHRPCQEGEFLLYLPSVPSKCVKNCYNHSHIHPTLSKLSFHQPHPTIKKDPQLSLCYQYRFMRQNLTIPPLTLLTRSISFHSPIILIVLTFVLVYSSLMLFTNIILANSIVYVWIGVMQSMTMVIASSCFYRYYCLVNGKVINSEWEYGNRSWLLVFGVVFAFMFIFGIMAIVKKKNHLKYVMNLVKLARVMFLDNSYLVGLIVVQLVISLGAIYFHLKMISIVLSFGSIDHTKSDPFNQVKPHPIRFFLLPLSLISFIWTYLICFNSSRFLLNCITIQWYFNEKLKGRDYKRFDNLVESVKLLYVHFGTVCYASLLSIFPRWLFKLVNFIKGSPHTNIHQNPLLNIAICSCCKYLSVYSHTYVILNSHQFQRANRQCCSLLDNIKSDTPQLYDLGDYYSRSALTFFFLFSFGFSYYAIILKYSNSITSFYSILAPIGVFQGIIQIVLLCTWMVSGIIINHVGFVGDVIVMMYQLERREIEEMGEGRDMNGPEGVIKIMLEMEGVE